MLGRMGAGTIMDLRQAVAFFLFLGVSVEGSLGAEPAERKAVDAAEVARQPQPGMAVPGAIAFTPDGRAVTYLKSESNSLSRVLWKVEVAPGSKPRVIARAPGEGNTDANVSPEEALRRERLRLRETGITQVVRAEEADVIVVPLQGHLHVLRDGSGPLQKITEQDAVRIDPKLTRDGTRVAFVRD